MKVKLKDIKIQIIEKVDHKAISFSKVKKGMRHPSNWVAFLTMLSAIVLFVSLLSNQLTAYSQKEYIKTDFIYH